MKASPSIADAPPADAPEAPPGPREAVEAAARAGSSAAASEPGIEQDRWALQRMYLEAFRRSRLVGPRRRLTRLDVFMFMIRRFGDLLRISGLYGLGVRNALDIRLTRIELTLADLPPEFDGYTILQLSDLHIDALPALGERIIDTVDGLEVDILALTGDYRMRVRGAYDHVLPAIERIAEAVTARDGRYAILGNHDPAAMAAPLEAMGYRVLLNDTVRIERGGAAVHLTGIDDVHYYYTNAAAAALDAGPEGFRIALVHSPEMIAEAADAGISLYLTGHTHGGQVCLPGGWPIISNASAGRRYAKGVWRHGAMLGHTSPGAGVSGLPVRFFCPGEASLLVLKSRAD